MSLSLVWVNTGLSNAKSTLLHGYTYQNIAAATTSLSRARELEHTECIDIIRIFNIREKK